METKQSRKEAIQKYKESKPWQGIFAVRCTATQQVWVGSSRNLDATRNGAWFSLRHGGYPDRSLQRHWDQHGEPAFEYQVLDRIEDDILPMAVGDLLKGKKQHWITQLGAHALL